MRWNTMLKTLDMRQCGTVISEGEKHVRWAPKCPAYCMESFQPHVGRGNQGEPGGLPELAAQGVEAMAAKAEFQRREYWGSAGNAPWVSCWMSICTCIWRSYLKPGRILPEGSREKISHSSHKTVFPQISAENLLLQCLHCIEYSENC